MKKIVFAAVAVTAAAALAGGEITRERYPDADVVVVNLEEDTSYRPDGTYRSVEDQWAKILTEKGRRDSALETLEYSARYGRAKFLVVEVFGEDGKSRRIDLAANVKEATDNGSMASNIYDPLDRRLACSIPGLRVGDTVHVRTERETFAARCENQWADRSILEWSVPIVRARVTIRAPKERPLRSIRLVNPLGNVVSNRTVLADGGIVHTWTATNSPQAFPEPDMPALHTQVQGILVSTASSWREISKWYWELSRPHMDCAGPAVTNKVRELGRDMKAIYKFVAQEVRYMGLTLEDKSPGYAPHDVNVTFDNRYGVCRDKAALLAEMLRIAGFEAYPVLIMVGTRHDPSVPLPFFNHAIVAVAGKDGYELMDPTPESSRDLLPAWLSNRSYLVARPEGEDLRVSPVPPADRNRFAIATTGTVEEDGSALYDISIACHGAADAALRGTFLRRDADERRKLAETLFAARIPGAELLRCDILPDDLRDTSVPLSMRLSMRTGEAILRGRTRDEISVPVLTRSFGLVHGMLRGSTALEKRRYPLELDMTCGSEESIRLKLPESFADPIAMPRELSEKGLFSFSRDAYVRGGEFVFSRNAAINGVTFSTNDYRALRASLARLEQAERDRTVFGRDRFADADIHDLRRSTEVSFAQAAADSPRRFAGWTVTNAVVRRILTYRAKKENSELKFFYNPACGGVRVLSATVSNLNGKVVSAGARETNVMDASWVAKAPRYPASRELVVSLPSVEIGSVVSYVTETTVTNPAAPYRGSWAFDGYDPVDEISVRVGDLFSRTERRVKRLRLERMTPEDFLWRDVETVVETGRDGESAFALMRPTLERAADVRPLVSEAVKAEGEGAALATAIRDWLVRHVRVTGPSLYELPVDLQLTDPARVVAERYATRLDFIRTLVALLRGAGFEADLVFSAANAGSNRESRRRIREDRPDVRSFSAALCRLKLREGGFLGFGAEERTVYLGTENEYTPLGATAHDGADYYDPAQGSFGVVRAGEGLGANTLERTRVRLAADGSAEVSVESLTSGAAVGGCRRRYVETLAEERSRWHRSLLAAVSQAAEPLGELETDATNYPARLSFSCRVKGYATVSDEAMTFVLPDFTSPVFTIEGQSRRAPISSGSCNPSTQSYEVVFPEGFGEIEHLPERYSIAGPDGKAWYDFTVGSSVRDGLLVVTVTRVRHDRDDAVFPAEEAVRFREWGRISSLAANRTLVVRRTRGAVR